MLFQPYPLRLPKHHWIYKAAHQLLRTRALGNFRLTDVHPFTASVLERVSQQPIDWVFIVTEPHVVYKLVLGHVTNPVTEQDQFFSVLVNQRGDVFEISVQAHKSFFSGSVFEGYMTVQSLPSSKPSPPNAAGEKSNYRQVFCIQWVEMVKGELFDGSNNYMRHYEKTHKLFDLVNKDMLRKNVFQWDRVAEEIILQDPDKIVCLGNAHGLKFQSVSCYRYKYIESVIHKNNFFPCLRIFPITDQSNVYQWEDPVTIHLLVEGSFTHHEWTYRLGFRAENKVSIDSDNMQWWDETKPQYSKQGDEKSHAIWYNLDRSDDLNTSTALHFLRKQNQTTFRLIGQFKCYVGHIPHTCCLKHIRWLNDGTLPHTKSQVEERLVVMYEKLQLNDLLKIVQF